MKIGSEEAAMTIPDTEALADAWFDSQAGRDGNSYDAYVAGFHLGEAWGRERVGVLTVELRDRLERLVGTVNAVNGADGDAFPDTRHEMLYGVADDIGAVIVELIRWAAVTEGESQR